jgi:hypothetical protein
MINVEELPRHAEYGSKKREAKNTKNLRNYYANRSEILRKRREKSAMVRSERNVSTKFVESAQKFQQTHITI